MTVPDVLLIVALAWLAGVALVRFVVMPLLARGPGGDPVKGAIWVILRLYCRVRHRVKFTNRRILPKSDADHEGLVVVSNHTGPVDPLAIQAGCRFLIRWMMAADMVGPQFDWLWRIQPMIRVARDGKDTGPLREAIRVIKAGGCVGIFPEGRITTPPREIRPFLPGAGLIIAKTHAPVLLVWVSGTPDTNKLGEALAATSHTRVAYLEMMDFAGERDPVVITGRLRDRIARASGWPLNDEVLPPGGAQANRDASAQDRVGTAA